MKKLLLGWVLMMLCVGSSSAFTSDLAQYQALFLYKFTEYFEWTGQDGPLVIGVLGNTRVVGELESLVQQRGRSIIVKKVAGAGDLEGCDMVYLADDQQRNLNLVVQETNGNSVLIVTETPDLARDGAGISFYVENNRLRFQLNATSIEARNIRINASIRGIATIVGP